MATLTPADFQALREAASLGLLKSLPPGRRTVSLTGRLSMKRDDFVKLIRAVGGSYHEHPGGGTFFLIVGDTSIHGRTQKMREAEARGTKIISETQFIEMITP
jgi:NAD-dependent DNA ligase